MEASRIIVHIDMDAFFAAIEQRDRPELRGLPVVVGSPPDRRGVVATCSYQARRFGIHSAMPSRTAYRLCPQAIFVPPRHDHYSRVSTCLMRLLGQFTPLVEPVSIDEAFLDLSGLAEAQADTVATVKRIKHEIKRQLGLTASAGIAVNKLLAKLASDLDKPDGLTATPRNPAAIRRFLAPLPVRKLWGVGPVTGDKLARFGIHLIGHLQAAEPGKLRRLLGKRQAEHLRELALGRDRRPVVTEWEEKSLSNEETFAADTEDRNQLRDCMIRLVEKVGRRLRDLDRQARTAQIKVRFADFSTITRQHSWPAPVDSDREMLRAALTLFDRIPLDQPVRLLGFGLGTLHGQDRQAPSGQQLLLFPESPNPESARDRALDRAVDQLRRRYGSAIIRRNLNS